MRQARISIEAQTLFSMLMLPPEYSLVRLTRETGPGGWIAVDSVTLVVEAESLPEGTAGQDEPLISPCYEQKVDEDGTRWVRFVGVI